VKCGVTQRKSDQMHMVRSALAKLWNAERNAKSANYLTKVSKHED